MSTFGSVFKNIFPWIRIKGGTIDNAVIDGGTQDLMNGLTLKGVTLSISSDGTTITASLSSTVGDTISFKFSNGTTEVDTSTPMTATVTAGTDEAPAYNYFYVAKSDPTTLVCASSKPSVERCGIGTAYVPSAATVQSKGVMYLHAAGNEISSSFSQGHISHISKWIRQQWATWISGVAPTISGSGTGTIQWASTEGKVFQAHENTFPAFTAGCDMYVVNDPDTAFRRITNFASLLKDSDGDSLTDKYYGLVIWGAMSDDGESKLFVNLPSRSEASAVKVRKDANKGVNYSIPDDFKGVGFLIYRLVLQNVGDTTWTVHSNSSDDIRGYLPNTTAGGDGVVPDLSSPDPIGDVTPNVGYFTELMLDMQELTDGANISWDVSSGAFAYVTLGGNRTLDNPTNVKAGGIYKLKITQDGTGSRTLSYGANFKFPGNVEPVLSSGAGDIDLLEFVAYSSTAIYLTNFIADIQ